MRLLISLSLLASAMTAQQLPKVDRAPHPGTYNYLAKLAVGGQLTSLRISTAVTESDDAWLSTETVAAPTGDSVDSTTLDGKTLELRKRSVKAGPAAIQVEFQQNKAVGSKSFDGHSLPFSVTVSGAVFAGNGSGAVWITCLPLAEGYSASFTDFDIQKQKLKTMQLTVTGSEKVTVPAGTFDSLRVDVSSAEGGPEKTTLWVARESRKVVRFAKLLPELKGATLVAELQ